MLFLDFVLKCILRILEGILSLVLGLIFLAPIFLIFWIINSFVRLIVSSLLWIKTRGQVQLTSHGLDNIWGYKTPDGGNSRTVLFLAVYSHVIDGERYRAKFLSDVINFVGPNGSRPYLKLKKIFTRSHGYYAWKEDTSFDIRNHVIVLEKDKVIREPDLFLLLEELAKDMDDSRPQWQEIIIPRFEYEGDFSRPPGPRGPQSARILRFHHSYGDAGSFLLLYNFCMAGGKIPLHVDPLKGFPIPSWEKALYYLNSFVFGATTLARAVYGGTNIRVNRLVCKKYSGKKVISWSSNPVELEVLKTIKSHTRTSIPTIIASAIASGLRTFDDECPKIQGVEAVDGRIGSRTDIGAVAAILPYPSLSLMNRYTIANLTVPTGRMTRVSRLKLTHSIGLRLSRSPEPLLNWVLFDFLGRFPAFTHSYMMQSAGTSMIFSNLPGASKPIELMGDRLETVGAWIPLLTIAGLSISASGYRDKVRLCGAADTNCMSKSELERLLSTIEKEINSLYDDCMGMSVC